VFHAFENITTAQLTQKGVKPGRDGIPTFRFAPDAQELFGRWRHELEHRLRSGTLAPAMEAHLGKYRKLVPALALLIHAAEAPGGDVSLTALQRALSWARYLESHAARVFASGAVAESTAVHTLLKKLCDGTAGLPSEFKLRDVKQKAWSGLTRNEDAESACDLLVEYRWLIATEKQSGSYGGRPTTIYHLNPQAKNAFNPAR